MSNLFRMTPIGDILRLAERQLAQSVDSIDGESLLNTPNDTISDRLEEAGQVKIAVLIEDAITSDVCEETVEAGSSRPRAIWELDREIHVRGTKATYLVPFEGDEKSLFWVPTRSHSSPLAHVEIQASHLLISVARPDHQDEEFRVRLDQTLRAIRQNLAQLREDVRSFNEGLRTKILELVEARKKKLMKDRALAASLPFPLRTRVGAQATFAVPLVRKRILPPLADPSTRFVPEPELGMEHYEHILEMVSSMTHVIERSPRHFLDIKEELLRSHFLVQLNGQYEGQATGETFNGQGRSDILVRSGDRNVFIAECKIWKGPKTVSEAIDQILRYATWRDTKLAILIFNKKPRFSLVLGQIPAVVEAHPCFRRRDHRYRSESGHRFIIARPEDPQREMILTVLAFDLSHGSGSVPHQEESAGV